MVICPKLNCTYLETPNAALRQNPQVLDPDRDISGYGVLIGFTGTGYITLILLIIQYALGFIPDSQVNPIDRGILHWLWKRTPRRPSSLWSRAIQKCVLLMSDQQMVTGIAILASGYFQLCAENSVTGIVSYDWEIIVYLGWFSSLTHLTTLTALRKYMIDNPIIRLWRLFLMLTIVVMLVVALVPTIQADWYGFYAPGLSSGGGVPAGCYYRSIGQPHYKVDTSGLLSLVVSLLVLLVGYTTKSIKLFPKQSDFVRWLFRGAPGRWWKRRLDRLYRRSTHRRRNCRLANTGRIRYGLELATLISIKAILDIYNSVVCEILWLIFGVGWGTMHLIITKLSFTAAPQDQGKGNDWGFGQFISTFLLVLPLLSLAEACYKTVRKLREERSLHKASVSHLSSIGTNTSDSQVPGPLRQQSSSTLLLSPSSALPAELRTLSFPAVTEETHTSSEANERSHSPYHQKPPTQNNVDLPLSPDGDPDQSTLSLLYPLHDHDFYQFPWFHHLIITLLIEAILLGALILATFSEPMNKLEYMLPALAPFWGGLCSVFPTCVAYSYICLCTHGQQEKRAKSGKPVWRSPGEIVLLILKWAFLVYIPVGSLILFLKSTVYL